mmetsp:Transcript_13802/g.28436  ORF Transcript_13802/g.28436 Transcript_13802/m.28436 type:complete len:216 (-) Transcript_13802:188-835(-)
MPSSWRRWRDAVEAGTCSTRTSAGTIAKARTGTPFTRTTCCRLDTRGRRTSSGCMPEMYICDGTKARGSAPLVLGTASTRCSGKHAAPVRGNSDMKKHTKTWTTTRRERDWESGERLFSCVLQRRDPRDKISDKSEPGPERDPTSEAVAGGGAQDSGPAVKAGPLNAHLTPVAAELEGPGPQPARAAPCGACLAAVDRESQLQEVRVREATRAGR